MSDLNPCGVSPETEIRILRKGKARTIQISGLQGGDYLHPGTGSSYWKCEGVNVFRSSEKAISIECSNGDNLLCTERTVLAGAAGNMLPSSRRCRPTVALLRQYLPTGEARRRFTVRLLNPERADKVVVSAFSKERKVFYDLDAAAQFMLKLKADRAELDYIAGVEIYTTGVAPDWEFLPVANDRPIYDRPVLPLFRATATPMPIVLARAQYGMFGSALIARVESVRELAEESREWCWPLFRGFRGENRSFAANGLLVFEDDYFISGGAYQATADRGEPPYFRIGKMPNTARPLSLEECFALKGETAAVEVLDVKEAADAFLHLSARMRASGVQVDDLLLELNRRATVGPIAG